MVKHCINHTRVIYDCCRHCSGKDIDCPEYLSSLEHSRQNLVSLKAGVLDGSIPSEARNKAEIYEKPFYFGHSDLMRETRLPKIDERIFMRRFREGQR